MTISFLDTDRLKTRILIDSNHHITILHISHPRLSNIAQ